MTPEETIVHETAGRFIVLNNGIVTTGSTNNLIENKNQVNRKLNL